MRRVVWQTQVGQPTEARHKLSRLSASSLSHLDPARRFFTRCCRFGRLAPSEPPASSPLPPAARRAVSFGRSAAHAPCRVHYGLASDNTTSCVPIPARTLAVAVGTLRRLSDILTPRTVAAQYPTPCRSWMPVSGCDRTSPRGGKLMRFSRPASYTLRIGSGRWR